MSCVADTGAVGERRERKKEKENKSLMCTYQPNKNIADILDVISEFSKKDLVNSKKNRNFALKKSQKQSFFALNK